MRGRLVGPMLFAYALATVPVAAQQPAAATSQAVPRRDQVEQATPSNNAARTSRVTIDTRDALARPPCALDSSPIRTTIRAVRFETPEGAPVAPALQELLAGVGTGPVGEQPIAVVCTIRDRANQLLSEGGYVALAQVPAQEIFGGELRLTIVSARIVEMRILGELGPFGRVMERRVDALRRLDPLNRRDAERILLAAGDIPGVDVRLALRAAGPGSRPGEVIGELSVETQRTQLLFNVQNFGSRQLGPVIGSVRAEAYGVTGLADRSFVAVSNSTDWDEIHVVQGGHDFALDDHGLRAAIRGSVALSRPSIPQLDLRSRSAILGAELSQQLWRAVDGQLIGVAGFELLNQRTQIRQGGVGVPFTRDRLRVVFARLEGNGVAIGRTGNQVASFTSLIELRKGLDLFGASQRGLASGGYPPSRFDGDPFATVIRSEVTGEVRPLPYLSLGGQIFAQWSDEPLLNLEEFSLGNFTYGRGYDPGSNGGDRVWAFRVEPRVRLPLGLPFEVELTGSYDHVRLFNLDTGATETNRTIRSVGGGVRLVRSRLFVLDAIYAHPLDRALLTDRGRPSDRLLVSLTVQALPWRIR